MLIGSGLCPATVKSTIYSRVYGIESMPCYSSVYNLLTCLWDLVYVGDFVTSGTTFLPGIRLSLLVAFLPSISAGHVTYILYIISTFDETCKSNK